MKKLLLILSFCFPLLLGQTVVYTNSAVVTWDNATTYTDGIPFQPGDIISYEVVITRPGNKANFTILGEVPAGPFTVTVPQEGDWLVGVRTVRVVGTERLISDFLWSDGTPNPFVLRFYKGPGAPKNLRLQ